nr:MAG TPA: hypothetical protein [Caudoviricetes sp.]
MSGNPHKMVLSLIVTRNHTIAQDRPDNRSKALPYT